VKGSATGADREHLLPDREFAKSLSAASTGARFMRYHLTVLP